MLNRRSGRKFTRSPPHLDPMYHLRHPQPEDSLIKKIRLNIFKEIYTNYIFCLQEKLVNLISGPDLVMFMSKKTSHRDIIFFSIYMHFCLNMERNRVFKKVFSDFTETEKFSSN